MYVNPEGSKVNQLQADIGRTIPKEDLKLGQKMKDGNVVKKDKTEELIKKTKTKKYPKVPSKEELPKMAKLKKKKKKKKNPKTDFAEFKRLMEKHNPGVLQKNKKAYNDKIIEQWYLNLFPPKPKPKPNYSKEQNIAQGGKVKKKYSYRRGGMTTLRKPKRG